MIFGVLVFSGRGIDLIAILYLPVVLLVEFNFSNTIVPKRKRKLPIRKAIPKEDRRGIFPI